MRWDDLFADLEARLDAGLAAELSDRVAERTRAERAAVHLADRLRAHRGAVELALVDGTSVTGRVRDAASTWLLVDDGAREHLVVLTAVAGVVGLTDRVAPDAGAVLSRLGLGTALRGLAQDRAVVRVRAAGAELLGRVDAVGADHLDLAELAPDSMRPTGRRRAVPFSAVAVLTSV